MIITKDNVKNNEQFLVKWVNGPYNDKNEFNPGFKTSAQSGEFLTGLEKETSIVKDSHFIIMESIEESIEHFRVHTRLQNMRKLSIKKVGNLKV